MVIVAKHNNIDIMSMSALEDTLNETIEIVKQNCYNLGFEEVETEVLTNEEYQAKKAKEPIPQQEPTEFEILRDYVLELDYRLVLMELGI